MVTSAPICDYLYAGECQCYVGRQRSEELLASLSRQHRVIQLQSGISKAAGALCRDIPDLWRQAVLFNVPCALPGFEVARLSAVHDKGATWVVKADVLCSSQHKGRLIGIGDSTNGTYL